MIHEYIYHENRFLICEEECIVKKRRFINRVVSFLTIFSLIIPNTVQFTVSAEESEKYPYSVFGRNGITMSASSNLCMNGNMHTNKNADISYLNGNINGRITTGNDIEKRVKHVYSDQKIMETYFTENCDLHEEEYVYSDMNIHINNPMFCYNNITLDGNVSLNSNLGSLMNINVTGEVKNANTSVVYSKYGDITIENDSTANINGLIYVPLGTLTINSPNINLNGVIIADKIVINGSSININYKDDIAQFIGNTSEVYDFSGLEYLPEEWLGDTDEDELFDIYEKVIDTDPFDSDTDDDGLPDGYEVITLNTDPLEIDTDENGISDADEDFDSDNLSNLGEYNHGTEPFNPDTDEDGFMDGDEVYTYGTEPLNPDTDNDGIKDGDEMKLGLDPLNSQTFGIPDSEYVVRQEISSDSEAFSVINTDENPFKVSLQAEAAGCVESNITVEESAFSEIIDNDSIVGITPEFQCDDTCKIDNVVVKFNIDTEKIENNSEIFDGISELQGMKRFCIFKYYEDINMLLPVETSYDEDSDTIYTETEDLGTYCVMDMENWISSFSYNEEQYQNSNEISTYDNQQLQINSSNRMQNSIQASKNTQFNIALPTNFTTIKLKKPLSPTSNTDSDSDGLKDWTEVDVKSGLIKWDSSGNVILPTLKECIFKASDREAVFSAILTYAKYLPNSMNFILNSPVLPIISNPCAIDSDGDGFPDKYTTGMKSGFTYKYTDPNPLMSDVKEYKLKKDLFNVKYEYKGSEKKWSGDFNSDMSYGGYQGWFGKYGVLGDKKIFCNNSATGYKVSNSGCGLIGVTDVWLYLGLRNVDYNPVQTSTANIYLNYNNYVNFDAYTNFTIDISNYFYIYPKPFNGIPGTGVYGSLQNGCRNICSRKKIKLNFTWQTSSNKTKCLNSMKNMLKEDLPVLFSYNDNVNLTLFKFENNEFSYTYSENIPSHYMVATGIIEFSDNAEKIIGYKTLLKVATYGKTFYADFDLYAKKLGFTTNIMKIEKK